MPPPVIYLSINLSLSHNEVFAMQVLTVLNLKGSCSNVQSSIILVFWLCATGRATAQDWVSQQRYVILQCLSSQKSSPKGADNWQIQLNDTNDTELLMRSFSSSPFSTFPQPSRPVSLIVYVSALVTFPSNADTIS